MSQMADHFDDREMLDEFVVEARGYFTRISAAIERLDAGEAEANRDLGRAAHSLRGAAGALGLSELAEAAQVSEQAAGSIAAGHLQWTAALGQMARTSVLAGRRYLTALASDPQRASTAELESTTALFAGYWQQEDPDDELTELLREEGRDLLDQMDEHLRALSRDLVNRQLLESVRRPTHTLKGAASTAGFFNVSTLAHRFEDLLQYESERTGAVSATSLRLFFETVEALEDLLMRRPGEQFSRSHQQLLESISAATAGVSVADETAESDPALTDTTDLTAVAASLDAGIKTSPETRLGTSPETPPTEVEPVIEEPVVQARPHSTEDDGDSDEAKSRRSDRLLRIPVDRLDEAIKVAGEALVHRAGFERYSEVLTEINEELSGSLVRLERLGRRLVSEYQMRMLADEHPQAPVVSSKSEFDSLELDRYTELHLISSELGEAISDIGALGSNLDDLVGDLSGYQGRLSRLLTATQDRLSRLRMVPFVQIQSRLFRTMRAAAQDSRKKAELVIDAKDVEIDKNVLDELSEPLLHVIRNAVDHGIESPQQRQVEGKSEHGTIRLTARQRGTHIEVEIEDDGRGLDLEAIQRRVVERGILTPEQVAILTPTEVAQLVFLPSVSTKDRVTQLSGRGIGLEVMKMAADRLRGSVAIENRSGGGVRLQIRLPMRLAALTALFVRVGEETYALPRAAVRQIVQIPPSAIETEGTKRVFRLGDDQLQVVELAEHLGLDEVTASGRQRPGLVVDTGTERLVVLVDSLGGAREVVVKSLGPLLEGLPGIVGATLTGDGKVILLVDTSLLARPIGHALNLAIQQPAATKPKAAREVLVVDDSLTVRRVLTRLLESNGWRAHSARNGVEALELIQGGLRPAAVLLDIEMPRMDGYELTGLLRADSRHAEIPIVMLTSRAGGKHRKKAMDLGVNAYLVKPYDEKTLLGTVRQVIAS